MRHYLFKRFHSIYRPCCFRPTRVAVILSAYPAESSARSASCNFPIIVAVGARGPGLISITRPMRECLSMRLSIVPDTQVREGRLATQYHRWSFRPLPRCLKSCAPHDSFPIFGCYVAPARRCTRATERKPGACAAGTLSTSIFESARDCATSFRGFSRRISLTPTRSSPTTWFPLCDSASRYSRRKNRRGSAVNAFHTRDDDGVGVSGAIASAGSLGATRSKVHGGGALNFDPSFARSSA